MDILFPGKRVNEKNLEREIQSARDRAQATDDPVMWVVSLILQAPHAAKAQEQMDKHPHGYHDKQARLFTLIDFNDTFVSSVLSVPEHSLPSFVSNLKHAIDVFCARARTRPLTEKQYEAIVHGLSREIAVYRGAIKEGFDAQMTSRAQDAMGVDMIITDPSTGRSINVDCKTHSSYYYRLKELQREGRLSSHHAEIAEKVGYCAVVNGHDGQQVAIVLWRIDQETYGTIQDFSFADTARLGEMLRNIIYRHGVSGIVGANKETL